MAIMTSIYHLPIQEQRLLDYLKQHGASSCKEIRNQIAIEHPSTIVSRIRANFGESCIKGQWRDGKNRYGEPIRFMMYSLSKEGHQKIFPVKKPFPGWINAIQRT